MRDDESGKYALSLKLHHLSQMQPIVGRIRKAAALPLQQLADRLHESCHLCILDGAQLAVLAQAHPSTRRICLKFDESQAFDPIDTCSGSLLLSRLTDEERKAILKQSSTYAARSVRKKKELRDKILSLQTLEIHQETSQIIEGIEDFCGIIGSPSTFWASISVARVPRHNRPAVPPAREIHKAMAVCITAISSKLGIGAEV